MATSAIILLNFSAGFHPQNPASRDIDDVCRLRSGKALARNVEHLANIVLRLRQLPTKAYDL